MVNRRDASALCIGIDIAWFGGSARNPDSQYDCIAGLHVPGEVGTSPRYAFSANRIPLINRDPDAGQLLQGIHDLVGAHDQADTVILALDAPLQAVERRHLPARAAVPTPGSIERRACENHLSAQRQRIDAAAGGAAGWQPNIQPGAPLPPRVAALLQGLTKMGFAPWTPLNVNAAKLIIECFPAEAIWAAKRMGHYKQSVISADAKAYKSQARKLLSRAAASKLFHDTLDAFAAPTGDPELWTEVVEDALAWLLADKRWGQGTSYRGGKLLDDAVDSMICLATALSHVNGLSHCWFDPDRTDDGHIIGPGLLADIGGR